MASAPEEGREQRPTRVELFQALSLSRKGGHLIPGYSGLISKFPVIRLKNSVATANASFIMAAALTIRVRHSDLAIDVRFS